MDSLIVLDMTISILCLIHHVSCIENWSYSCIENKAYWQKMFLCFEDRETSLFSITTLDNVIWTVNFNSALEFNFISFLRRHGRIRNELATSNAGIGTSILPVRKLEPMKVSTIQICIVRTSFFFFSFHD